jgi:hypothetical protein
MTLIYWPFDHNSLASEAQGRVQQVPLFFCSTSVLRIIIRLRAKYLHNLVYSSRFFLSTETLGLHNKHVVFERLGR